MSTLITSTIAFAEEEMMDLLLWLNVTLARNGSMEIV